MPLKFLVLPTYLVRSTYLKKFPSSSLFLGAPCCQKCELWQIAKGIWAKVKPSASVKLSIKLHEKFNFVSRVPLETASHLLVHSSRAKHGKVWKWHSYVSSVYQRVYQSVLILSFIFKVYEKIKLGFILGPQQFIVCNKYVRRKSFRRPR